MSATRRHPAGPSAGADRSRGGTTVLIAVVLVVGGSVLAVGGAGQGRAVLAAVQRFMLAYSGVFALIALTAAVAAGLIATDRLIMTPAGRVVSQAMHRALSLAAAGFLVTHVLLEILAHRSRPVDAVAPFLAGGRMLWLGLGTVASDLVLLILVTGVARRRFAAGRPGAWRAVHVSAYVAWLLAIVHGLLAGRHPQPYVDWSYGACMAAVALALLTRLAVPARRPAAGRTAARSLPASRSLPAARSLPASRSLPARSLPPRSLPPSRSVPRGRSLPPAGPGHAARGTTRRAAKP